MLFEIDMDAVACIEQKKRPTHFLFLTVFVSSATPFDLTSGLTTLFIPIKIVF